MLSLRRSLFPLVVVSAFVASSTACLQAPLDPTKLDISVQPTVTVGGDVELLVLVNSGTQIDAGAPEAFPQFPEGTRVIANGAELDVTIEGSVGKIIVGRGAIALPADEELTVVVELQGSELLVGARLPAPSGWILDDSDPLTATWQGDAFPDVGRMQLDAGFVFGEGNEAIGATSHFYGPMDGLTVEGTTVTAARGLVPAGAVEATATATTLVEPTTPCPFQACTTKVTEVARLLLE